MKMKRCLFSFLVLLLFMIACQRGGRKSEAGALTGYPEIDQATMAIKENPNKATAYLDRAEAYLLYESYDQAIKDLKQAIRLDSNLVDAWHLMADAYLDYYNSRMAMNTLYDAAERFPNRVPTLLKLTEYQYILTLTAGAEKTIDRILSLDPLNAEAWFWRGMIARDAEKNTEAIQAFQKATELDPFLTDAWIECGKLLSKEGKPIALRFFQNAVQLDSLNAPAWHALAEYYQDQNNLDAALETYRELVRLNPLYPDAYYNSGLIWMERDSLGLSRAQLDLAIKVDPTFAKAYLARGNVLELQGDPVAARRDYEQALILDPNLGQASRALDRMNQ
jgi:Tfp pilus assembly protein PilF